MGEVSSYILNLMPSTRKHATPFSSFTKALIQQKIKVARHNFCEVCDPRQNNGQHVPLKIT